MREVGVSLLGILGKTDQVQLAAGGQADKLPAELSCVEMLIVQKDY